MSGILINKFETVILSCLHRCVAKLLIFCRKHLFNNFADCRILRILAHSVRVDDVFLFDKFGIWKLSVDWGYRCWPHTFTHTYGFKEGHDCII